MTKNENNEFRIIIKLNLSQVTLRMRTCQSKGKADWRIHRSLDNSERSHPCVLCICRFWRRSATSAYATDKEREADWPPPSVHPVSAMNRHSTETRKTGWQSCHSSNTDITVLRKMTQLGDFVEAIQGGFRWSKTGSKSGILGQ